MAQFSIRYYSSFQQCQLGELITYLALRKFSVAMRVMGHRRRRFPHEARILMNSAAVVDSGLREVAAKFVTCFEFGKKSSAAQASRVAEFVMPTQESASIFSQALLDVSVATTEHPDGAEVVEYGGTRKMISDRLQEKLDQIERDQC